ncbi:Rid family hydrolase [Maridesulfovibrio bastinii]|uniref:Rid family hydrolase n=1 Tax=Maridesulfovibrio bastinii TaxID=47157 RepID=UPI000425108A|nr:Rid family hydrolase [Maridesulfovibrio bastinii]
MSNPISFSKYKSNLGDEIYIAAESRHGLDFTGSVQDILGQYKEVMQQEGLSDESGIFLRFHLSDIANQLPLLKQRIKDIEEQSFISIIGQPPAMGGKIALEAYHIKTTAGSIKVNKAQENISVTHGNYCSQWIKSKIGIAGSSYEQTHQAFTYLDSAISKYKATIRDNVIRTWIYVRDIDNNYQGMVDARRELFDSAGLTKESHYIASTGIEGSGYCASNLINMDTLCITGINPDQITYMNAPDYLCPTYDYNVTFERATRVMYGDRSHYYISGTASIDLNGEILHPQNVIKQAERTLINIEALLQQYKAEMEDLKILVIYLRDPSDAQLVNSFLRESLPESLAWIMVKGAVCRPGWLIEMEGIAISKLADSKYGAFC